MSDTLERQFTSRYKNSGQRFPILTLEEKLGPMASKSSRSPVVEGVGRWPNQNATQLGLQNFDKLKSEIKMAPLRLPRHPRPLLALPIPQAHPPV